MILYVLKYGWDGRNSSLWSIL